MKTEIFDFNHWREGLPKKTSKLEAARKMGLDKNVYNKYEREGAAPKYIVLAAKYIEDVDRKAALTSFVENGYKMKR